MVDHQLMQQDERDRYVEVSEAAREIGIAAATIRLWADTGRIPCIRTLSGRRMFKLQDVRAAAEARAQELQALREAACR